MGNRPGKVKQGANTILTHASVFPTLPRVMARHFVKLAILGVCCCWLAGVWAEEPPPPADAQLLLLRNGEVLAGHISRDGDSYRLTLADGEVRVKQSDVELICHNLDEAYLYKHNRLALGRIDDHLDLAEWALRQGLPGYAAKEIAASLAIDPKNPRVDFLDRRLKQSLDLQAATAKQQPTAEAHRVSNEDLDRMVRGMPPGAVEAFTETIQPLLMNSCATSSCHGPGSKSNYVLIRIPPDRTGNRRLTQRNLYGTIQMLDYQSPSQSRLLGAASKPHGNTPTAIFDSQTVKYRQLLNWIAVVTEKPAGVEEVAEGTVGRGQWAAGVQPASVNVGNQLSVKSLEQPREATAANSADSHAGPAKLPDDHSTAKPISPPAVELHR
jgi:hypothetical protein